MTGFVDVTGWSSEAVKRLGQRDDDFGIVDSPRRSRRTYAKPVSVQYSMSDVWAAACAAHRINDGYVKDDVYQYNEDTQTRTLAQRRNRDIMMEFLANPHQLLVEDVERGEEVRSFLQKDLTFRGIKGKLTDFDIAASRCLAVTNFDSVQHRYELAVVACLPNSAVKQQTRQNSEERMKFARGGFIEQPGAVIQAQVEVISCGYSQQYNIFWIRGITDKDQPVFFSNKEKFDVGTWLTIKGKVKAHKDNMTQLNYVKVL